MPRANFSFVPSPEGLVAAAVLDELNGPFELAIVRIVGSPFDEFAEVSVTVVFVASGT